MKDWQKTVQKSVGPGITDIIEQVREKNPDHQVRANFVIHFPEDFAEGEDAIIPVSAPSKDGPVHIADVHLDITEDMYIASVQLAVGSMLGFEESQVRPEKTPSLKNTFDRVADVFGGINVVFQSQAMQSLLAPNIGGTQSLPVTTITGGEQVLGPQGRQISKVPGRSKSPSWYNMQKQNQAVKEAEVVKGITNSAQREKYIVDSLKSAVKAPSWYYALGGKAKETLRDRVVTSYLNACVATGETIPADQFFGKLTEKMAKQANILPYCERDNDFVRGTATGKCKQVDCSMYREIDCPRFSFRLNQDKSL